MSQLRDCAPSIVDAEWIRRPAAAAFAVLLGWLVIGSLWPFIPVSSGGEWWQQIRYAFSWCIGEPVLNTVIERCLALAPLGFAAYWSLAHRNPARAARQATVFVIAGVSILEILQTAVLARHARLTDAALGIVAGILGIRLAVAAWRRQPAWLASLHRLGWGVMIGGVVVANLGTCAGIAVFHWKTGLENWDRTFPLVVANEASWDRPWLGRMYGFAIYPRALKSGDVSRLSSLAFDDASLAARQVHQPLAVYHFGTRAEISDGFIHARAGERGPALRLPTKPGQTRMLDDCLDVLAPAVIMSEGGALGITEALIASGEFSLEARFEPEDLKLKGPARIVSLSADPENRNFTLAQVYSTLVFRLRTPIMGRNGMNMPFGTQDGAISRRPCHAFVTYANGTLRMYVDGREPWRALHLYWPSNLIMRGTWAAGGIVLAAMLFTPLGLIAGYRIRETRSRAVVACMAAGVGLFPILTSVSLTAAYHRVYELRFLIAIALFSALGVLLGRRIAPKRLPTA